MAGRWRIAEQISEGAIDPDVRGALAALGYEFIRGAGSGGSAQAIEADLWVVDAENVDRIPRPSTGSLRPIIILTREPGRSSSDPRVVASLARPVSLSALYAVLQIALENVGSVGSRSGVMVRGQWFPEAELQSMLEDVVTRQATMEV